VERNIQRNGLVNLLALLAVGAAAYGIAQYANSLAGQVAAVFLALGVLVAFVSWFQMRLEGRERLEKLELDELARSKGSATLFEGKDAEVFPAQQSREQFEKYFVPAFTVVLLLLQVAATFVLWRWLAKVVTVAPLKQEMVAMSLLGLLALILFLIGRFSATIARLENHRLLRPSASYLLLGAYLCALSALAIAGVKGEFPKTDLYVARGLVIVLGLAAVETLATLVFEIYRPRVKGKVARPLYDSRFVGLLAQPEGLVATAAQTLDYQFGFKVSETWFYQAIKQAARWMFLLQLAALLLSTCVVFIEPGEQALLERFGKRVEGSAVLNPGAHFKLPWPVDKIYRYRTEQIQTLNVGAVPEKEEQESRVALWTAGHPHDENFLVANRGRRASEATSAGAAKKAPPVSLLTVGIPVQFQIHDLVQWAYNHEDSATLLQQLATREVIRYLVSVDLSGIMSSNRLESSLALRDHIQAAADVNHLGAKVLFVGLQDLHPPVKVAPEYEKVGAADHLKQSKILAAQAYAISTNILAGAQAFTLTNNAEAARLDLELTASARAAAFTNQLPAYNAAPSVYLQRAYLQTFAAATAKTTKYLLLATNTTDVIQFDLQRRLDDDIFNQVAGKIAAPKK
jgi:regulator of protease activity HflC (stomatin/prohibitin superfamily)